MSWHVLACLGSSLSVSLIFFVISLEAHSITSLRHFWAPQTSLKAASATNYAIINHYPDWAQEGAAWWLGVFSPRSSPPKNFPPYGWYHRGSWRVYLVRLTKGAEPSFFPSGFAPQVSTCDTTSCKGCIKNRMPGCTCPPLSAQPSKLNKLDASQNVSKDCAGENNRVGCINDISAKALKAPLAKLKYLGMSWHTRHA